MIRDFNPYSNLWKLAASRNRIVGPPVFQSRFGAEKLRSSHLYQLCAYLHNLEHKGEVDREVEGILLYPAAGTSLDLSYCLHGRRVSVLLI